MAFDGTNYLLVWADSRHGSEDILAARVRPSGEVLDPEGIVVCDARKAQVNPGVAFDGSRYFVVWEDHRDSFSGEDIFAARVSRSGVVIDTEAIPISTKNASQTRPSVAFDGTDYLVVWEDSKVGTDSGDIFGARVGRSGVVRDPDGIAISTVEGLQAGPQVAFNGTDYLVVWEDVRSGDPGETDVYGSLVSPSGKVEDPSGVPISTAQRGQLSPSLASDGTDCLVCWQDKRGEEYWMFTDLYCCRVNKDGTPLDQEGILITTAFTDDIFPGLAFDGENYLVVWVQSANYSGSGPALYGTRVNREGAVIDPEHMLITSSDVVDFPPRPAFGNGEYLVVWEEGQKSYIRPEAPCSGGELRPDIFGATVTASGVVQKPGGTPLAVEPNWQQEPASAFGGDEYMVVWADWREGWDNPDIYGARVSPYGAVSDTEPIGICIEPGYQTSPAISYDGEHYLVVWTDLERIWAARVTPEGEVLDPDGIPVSSIRHGARYPAVAFDGTNYLVLWWDTEWMFESDGIHRIRGARVSRSGEVLDPDGTVISSEWRFSAGCNMAPHVTFNGSDYMVVWEQRTRHGTGGMYWCDYPASIVGAIVSPELDVSRRITVSSEGADITAGIACDGTNCLVVWQSRVTRDGTAVWNIFARGVSPSGTLLGTGSTVVARAEHNQADPSVAFDGTHYVVVWRAQQTHGEIPLCRDIRLARLDLTAAVVDSPAIRIPCCDDDHGAPAVCAGDEGHTLAVYPGFGGPPESRFYRIWGRMLNPKAAPAQTQLELAPTLFSTVLGIRYSLPAEGRVKISVYDAAGRLVRLLFQGRKGPGWHEESWSGDCDGRTECTSGIYFIRLESAYGAVSRKCIYVK